MAITGDHVDDRHGSAGYATETPESAHEDAAVQVVGARRPADLPRDLHLGPSTATATVGIGAAGSGDVAIPAFDEHHPPSRELISDCVHCGFCLPTCPTYLLWGEEMDSPRGRIYLMGAGLDGAPLDDTMVRHFDQCLGCMACVTACPSGVQYGKLIEATRPQVERRHRRPMKERLLRESMFALFPYPARLRALRGPLRLAQRAGLANGRAVELLPRRLRLMAELAPKLGPPPHIPARTPAMGTRRRTVGLLLGCVQRAFFPDVNAATVRVLSAEGCEVVVPPAAGCCGALSAHSGREPEALEFAKRTIQAFEDAGVDTVVTNAAGCGSNIKDYGWLLRDEPGWAERAQALAERTRDVVELLTELPQAARRYPLELRVAYHDACHLAHAQGVRRQPREMLRSIPGMELVDIPEGEICCGSAGVYNLLQPRPAAELGERKARHVVAVDPELLVTANPGCWMQIGRHAQALGYLLPVAHTVQVLDASIRGIPASSLRQQALHGPGTMLPRRS